MFPLFYQETSASTNDDILNYLAANRGGCALFTFNQTAGRGQYGNRWEAARGENIAYTLALPCREISATGQVFNYHTACALRNFLAKLTNASVEIKWPNDIIINQRKIAGILIEKKKVAGIDYYILGIGINVLQTDFQNITRASSLYAQTGIKYDLNDIAEGLNLFLAKNLMLINPEKVLAEFNHHLFRKDRISVFEIDNLRQNGIIKYADADGFLWMDLERDGLKKFYHKQVSLLY